MSKTPFLAVRTWAWPAAERRVVHLPMPVRGRVAQVVGVQLEQPPLKRATHHPSPEDRFEDLGEDGDHVETHR